MPDASPGRTVAAVRTSVFGGAILILVLCLAPAAYAEGKDPFRPVSGPGAPSGSGGGVRQPAAPTPREVPPPSMGGRLPRTGVDIELPVLLAALLRVAGSWLRLAARPFALKPAPFTPISLKNTSL